MGGSSQYATTAITWEELMTGPQGTESGGQWPQQPAQGSEAWQTPQGSEPSAPADQTWAQQPAYGQPASSYPATGYEQQQPGYADPNQQYAQQGFGQPGGQFSGGFGAPGGGFTPTQNFGSTPFDSASSGSNKTLLMIGGIGVAAVALIAVLVLGFWVPGWFVTTTLDVNKAQEGVTKILSDQVNGYGIKDVKNVKCNNGTNPEVKKGDSFSCDVTVDGSNKQVKVIFQDDNGRYEVGRPQ